MTVRDGQLPADVVQDAPQIRGSVADRQERKEQLLTQGRPSVVGSIAEAVVAKDGEVFLVVDGDGSIPFEGEHGFGLFFRDCRYLNGFELSCSGVKLNALAAVAPHGTSAVIELTNPDDRSSTGALIPHEQLGVTWLHVVDGEEAALHSVVEFRNLGLDRVELPVSVALRSEFEDLFEVRGLLRDVAPTVETWWDAGTLSMSAKGVDGRVRSIEARFSPAPVEVEDMDVRYQLVLEPRGSAQIGLSVAVRESGGEVRRPATTRHAAPSPEETRRRGRRSAIANLDAPTRISSDSLLLEALMSRSLTDIGMLKTRLGSDHYLAAGIPWFATLFGRDSILASLQTLAFDPSIAAGTLPLLARLQGTESRPWRDEEPGKMPHELRVGELANAGQVPYDPYYGTVDATPLFLILLGRYVAWTGDLNTFRRLRENVDRALLWMSQYGDSDGDGYIEYRSEASEGLINQGWKDSGNAIVMKDGTLAKSPIAVVEVQAYTELARREMAAIFRSEGEVTRAEELDRHAARIREGIERDFWDDDEGCYVLALQGDKSPAAVVSSNAGHVLWTGTASADRARRTAVRLSQDDMWSGWGVRTLSTEERAYNPVGYHLGTVWPHDNSMIAAGFRRYGLDREALRILESIARASTHFRHYRLPEVFAGFDAELYGAPVPYPVACHPQAWAAGSVPYMLESVLGLLPEATERRLRIVRPTLPSFVDRLEMTGLRVAEAVVDLLFRRGEGDSVQAEVTGVTGDIDVQVQD